VNDTKSRLRFSPLMAPRNDHYRSLSVRSVGVSLQENTSIGEPAEAEEPRIPIRSFQLFALSWSNGTLMEPFFDFDLTGAQLPVLELLESGDGDPWGRIPDSLAPYPRSEPIQGGEIIVPTGNPGEGFMHIRRKHERNISGLHPRLTLEEYLRDVLRHFQRAYLQPDGSIWLFRKNGVTKAAVVAPITVGGKLYYKVITAYSVPREPTAARMAKRGAVRLDYG
jgi:hypothetical protein